MCIQKTVSSIAPANYDSWSLKRGRMGGKITFLLMPSEVSHVSTAFCLLASSPPPFSIALTSMKFFTTWSKHLPDIKTGCHITATFCRRGGWNESCFIYRPVVQREKLFLFLKFLWKSSTILNQCMCTYTLILNGAFLRAFLWDEVLLLLYMSCFV